MYKGEDTVLALIAKRKKLNVQQIAQETGMHPDTVRRIVESLKAEGYVHVEKDEKPVSRPLPELLAYFKTGFPEFAVYEKARQGKTLADLTEAEKKIGLTWARKKGLILIENGKIIPAKDHIQVEAIMQQMRQATEQISRNGETDMRIVLDEFFRRNLVQRNVTRHLVVLYTDKPVQKMQKTFNIDAEGQDADVGKNHPITKMAGKIRSIMTDLGFEEMTGSIVESSFWNFDALFQPQDHPARELADTFYLEGEEPLPEDRKLVERIRKSHEIGWKYNWNPKEAQKPVLRTHTTALSARYLASLKDKQPKKYFAIGKVFRNEATDYKHLAEFYQVDGIIAWENATFRDLLGILKEFYAKLGFSQIRFRPSYFPYTEPSLEVEVFFEPKKQWMELGGAGMFRPEVSIPLAGVYPVLAWGLSLERPLMIMLELEDIRTFYRNDLQFLKSARVDV